jgi:hypothetical protein
MPNSQRAGATLKHTRVPEELDYNCEYFSAIQQDTSGQEICINLFGVRARDSSPFPEFFGTESSLEDFSSQSLEITSQKLETAFLPAAFQAKVQNACSTLALVLNQSSIFVAWPSIGQFPKPLIRNACHSLGKLFRSPKKVNGGLPGTVSNLLIFQRFIPPTGRSKDSHMHQRIKCGSLSPWLLVA